MFVTRVGKGNKKSPSIGRALKVILVLCLSNHEAPIEYFFVFCPKPGVAPVFEFVYFFADQEVDGFAKLFFKEKRAKTHFGEHSFNIVQHGKNLNSLKNLES